MALNHKGIGLLLGLNFVFIYIGFLLITYTTLKMWIGGLLVIAYVAYNVYIIYESLNYIDTQDEHLALPIVALVVSSVCLLIVVAVLAILFIAMVKASENGGK